MPSPTPLYQIEECPDLYVDACVCDEQRNLVFLSAWGRDTVTQEFLARLWAGKRVARQNFSGQTPQNLSFTPRARAGRDHLAGASRQRDRVSIHAPVRGATYRRFRSAHRRGVSIHAPVRGATALL